MKKRNDIIDIVYQFSVAHNAKISKWDLRLLIESSPFYPSILSIFRALQNCDISCEVIKTDVENLNKIPNFFIIHIEEDKKDKLVLIQKMESSHWAFYDTISRKYKKETIHKILNNWDGIVLFSNEKSQKHYTKLSSYIIIITSIIISLLAIILNPNIVLLIINLLGLFISSQIYLKEKNITSFYTQKFCYINKTVNCDDVLHSKASKIGIFSLAELAIIYFSSNIFLVINCFLLQVSWNYINNYIFWENILCLPIIFYSLYSQFIIKRWCVFCLSISIIIIIQIVLFPIFNNITYSIFIIFKTHIFLLFIVTSIMFFLNKYIDKDTDCQQLQINLLSFKRKIIVFKSAFNRKQRTDNKESSFLLIGSKKSAITITTWLSPYCTYCAQIVNEMDKLIKQKRNKIQWHIYFYSIENIYDIHNRIPLFLISYYIKNHSSFIKILKDWYKHKNTSLIKKSKINDVAYNILEHHVLISHQLGIKKFPYILINGIPLPNQYSINDIKYMISDIEFINYIKRDI